MAFITAVALAGLAKFLGKGPGFESRRACQPIAGVGGEWCNFVGRTCYFAMNETFIVLLPLQANSRLVMRQFWW